MTNHKHLFILRHAKSSWRYPQLADFDRPLNNRGRRNLPFMADYLSKNYADVAPQHVLSSGAKRALVTAEGFAKALDLPIANADQPHDLYHARRSELIRLVKGISNDIQRAMLVGHNPGLTDFANYLMHPEDEKIFNIPTCAFVVLRFELDDWSRIHRSAGRLLGFEFPKKFQ